MYIVIFFKPSPLPQIYCPHYVFNLITCWLLLLLFCIRFSPYICASQNLGCSFMHKKFSKQIDVSSKPVTLPGLFKHTPKCLSFLTLNPFSVHCLKLFENVKVIVILLWCAVAKQYIQTAEIWLALPNI